MRFRSLVTALTLFACKETPKADPPPPPPPPAEAASTFQALTPGARCTYEVKEVMTEALGEQLFAGHEVTVTYELTAKKSDAPIAFDAKVTRVQADARRETYSAKLDSTRSSDLMRVKGGADTVVMYEMVAFFAMLDRVVSLELDARGRLLAVKGGDLIREAMLALHPPKPRGEPHYQKKVEVVLSDAALAEIFLPSARVVPERGPLESGRTETSTAQAYDLVEYVGFGSEAVRISMRPNRWLFEQKRAFGPTDRASAVPPIQNTPIETQLMRGDRSVTVEFEPNNPCFKQAGASFNDLAVWTGPVEDAQTTTDRKRSFTRIWQKK